MDTKLLNKKRNKDSKPNNLNRFTHIDNLFHKAKGLYEQKVK
jgi:hypothetical protein